MSETVANDLLGLLNSAQSADAAVVRSDAGDSKQVLDRVELGRELSAMHQHSFGWALSCCRWDRETAEDVLHTTYLKVLDGKARFAGHASFRTWLFAVIRMTARETRSKKWRRNLVWQKYAPRSEDVVSPTQGGGVDTEKLRTELASLPERQREILHLVFYGDLSIREAAEVMGVSLGTARTHYERGKKKLRVRLGVEEDK